MVLQPVCDVIADWASVTLQLRLTALTYQPFNPFGAAGERFGTITGGVISAGATT